MAGRMFAMLLGILLLATPVLAREAGWVPLPKETYKPPLKPGAAMAKKQPAPKQRQPAMSKADTVYERQPLVTEPELMEFISLLPQFRAWARQCGEDAHPIVNSAGKPDFHYSAKAADWVKKHGFAPARFFCVMGRMAAGIVIIEEGNDLQGVRPRDMPPVDQQEVSLARRHLGELLTAAGQSAR